MTGHSPTRPLVVKVRNRGPQADPSAALRLDLIEDLPRGPVLGVLGHLAQLDGQVLVQGLVSAFGIALQGGVDVIREVAYYHGPHRSILAAHQASGPLSGGSFRLSLGGSEGPSYGFASSTVMGGLPAMVLET